MEDKMKSCRSYLLFLLVLFISFSFAQNSDVVRLPPPQTEIGKPLMQTLKLRKSSREFDTKSLSLQELSNMLWAANGINRPESGKRTAPSAMNWQEVDIYVAMQEGTYIYNAKDHSLLMISVKDLRRATGTQTFVKNAPVDLVYVVNGKQMQNADEKDKILYGAADVGFIAQNVYLYCASQGLAVVVRGMIDRETLTKELKLEDDQTIILSQTVGYPSQ